jgi:hypothetical protein
MTGVPAITSGGFFFQQQGLLSFQNYPLEEAGAPQLSFQDASVYNRRASCRFRMIPPTYVSCNTVVTMS